MTILEGLQLIEQSGLPHPEWQFISSSKELDSFYNTKDYVGWTIRTVDIKNGPWKNLYVNWLKKDLIPAKIDKLQKQHIGLAIFVVYPSWYWSKAGTIMIKDDSILIEAVDGGIVELMRQGKLTASYHFLDNKLIKITGRQNFLKKSELKKILQAKEKIKINNIILEWGLTTNNQFIFYRIENISEAGRLLIKKYGQKQKINKRDEQTNRHFFSNNQIIGLTGLVASPGRAKGKVVIIKNEKDFVKMEERVIIVTKTTNPNYIPLIKQSSAIITEQGGVTSHIAIVCRELKIPCLVNTGLATKIFKDNEILEVNFNLKNQKIKKLF